MISEPNQIGDVFSCLHDGRIVRAITDGDRLLLEVQIQYLAERVHPRYCFFSVHLDYVADLEFSTWPNDRNWSPTVLTHPAIIFAPCLEILEGSAVDGKLVVTCNQPSSRYDYCGGELRARVGSVKIADEGGETFSLGALEALSRSYRTIGPRRPVPDGPAALLFADAAAAQRRYVGHTWSTEAGRG